MALLLIIVKCVLTLLRYLRQAGPAGFLSTMHYRDESHFWAFLSS